MIIDLIFLVIIYKIELKIDEPQFLRNPRDDFQVQEESHRRRRFRPYRWKRLPLWPDIFSHQDVVDGLGSGS